MTKPLSAQQVRAAFNRAAGSYDDAASVQRHVCQRLLDVAGLCPGPLSVLDAGCGTGYGARLLRRHVPDLRITGVDFAPAMLARAQPDLDEGLVANIEHLPFPGASFDLWWSSLAVQWCCRQSVFTEAARVLKPGGKLAFSTLGPDTFHELDTAFAQVDHHRHRLAFSTPDQIHDTLAQAGFGDIHLWREQHVAHHPDLKSLLRSVKAIGAQNVGAGRRQGMLGRQAWRTLELAYERHREAAGLPASYDVILGVACRQA